jgi:putative transposase
MSRPLRLEFAGAVFHVTSRGNERREIFRDDEDRQAFLEVLGRVVSMFGFRLYGWVLMGNHYHLLLETPEPTLVRGMRQLNGLYTQRFNRRHRRSGHLFQGRYKAILVEKEAHLMELSRYLVLNPVRAGLVRSAKDWPWSSYRATVGQEAEPPWLDVDGVLGPFGGRRAAARQRFRAFVSEGLRSDYSPWEQVTGQLFLGGEAFLEAMRERIKKARQDGEIPRRQRSLGRPGLKTIAESAAKAFGVSGAQIRRRRGGAVRLAVAYVARTEGVLPLSEIGGYLNVRSWSASHMATAAEERMATDGVFRRQVAATLRALK